MRAAVCHTFGEPLTIEELTLDPPGNDEVRVEIHACAICASDLHAADGSWGGSLPAVFGHEASGIVSEVGASVTTVAVGDRVVVSLLRSCRDCFFCDGNESHLCEKRGDFDIANSTRLHLDDGTDVGQGVYTGAFAEEVVVHGSQVEAVGDGVSFEAAALMACGVATGYGAVVNTVDVPSGSTIAVIGTGGVGLNAVQGGVATGASKVIAVDVAQAKLDDAMVFGATDQVLLSMDEGGSDKAIADVQACTSGRGADYVFVTVGNTAAIEQGIEMARNGGTVVVVGMTKSGAHAHIETSGFAGNGKTVVGSFLGSTDLPRDIPTMSECYLNGELKLDELVTGRFSLDEINDAIASTKAGEARRNMIVMR